MKNKIKNNKKTMTIGRAYERFDLEKQTQYEKKNMYKYELDMFLRMVGLNLESQIIHDKYTYFCIGKSIKSIIFPTQMIRQ